MKRLKTCCCGFPVLDGAGLLSLLFYFVGWIHFIASIWITIVYRIRPETHHYHGKYTEVDGKLHIESRLNKITYGPQALPDSLLFSNLVLALIGLLIIAFLRDAFSLKKLRHKLMIPYLIWGMLAILAKFIGGIVLAVLMFNIGDPLWVFGLFLAFFFAPIHLYYWAVIYSVYLDIRDGIYRESEGSEDNQDSPPSYPALEQACNQGQPIHQNVSMEPRYVEAKERTKRR